MKHASGRSMVAALVFDIESGLLKGMRLFFSFFSLAGQFDGVAVGKHEYLWLVSLTG
jgi:hypothetical protein